MRNLTAICFGICAAASAANFAIELAFAPSIFNNALTGWGNSTIGWTVAFALLLRGGE